MDWTPIEWARLTADEMLVATAREAWVEPAGAGSSGVMLGPGSRATTRKLLDGAIGAAFAAAEPGAVPEVTRTRWVFRLCGMYHLTHRTAPLMIQAARRFARAGRTALADWAEEKAREERGHDRLALRDLAELGYPAEAVAAVVPPIAGSLVGYFEETVHAEDPIGCVGYSYALERLATTVRAEDIRRVEAVLPPGSRATRCLRVHSAEGGDADHVVETVALVAGLTGPERTQVALACHHAARLCFATPPGGHPSDDALEDTLRGLRRAA
jgi:hypothetical protein